MCELPAGEDIEQEIDRLMMGDEMCAGYHADPKKWRRTHRYSRNYGHAMSLLLEVTDGYTGDTLVSITRMHSATPLWRVWIETDLDGATYRGEGCADEIELALCRAVVEQFRR